MYENICTEIFIALLIAKNKNKTENNTNAHDYETVNLL